MGATGIALLERLLLLLDLRGLYPASAVLVLMQLLLHQNLVLSLFSLVVLSGGLGHTGPSAVVAILMRFERL